MSTISLEQVIGIDVSRDWLDIHCLPDGRRLRLPNAPDGHAQVACLARRRNALVCFEGREEQKSIRESISRTAAGRSGGCWLFSTQHRLSHPTTAARPGQSLCRQPWHPCQDRPHRRGTHRPLHGDATRGRAQPSGWKLPVLRALTSKRAQLVEMRKRLLAQIKAHQKLGTAELFDDVDADLKGLLDTRIAEMEERIAREIAGDDTLAETACILRSIPGIGPVASAMLLAEMPELGAISGEQAAALTELAPIAHDSGVLRGKRAIAGGRRALRHVMFQAALVAAHHNPTLKAFAQRLGVVAELGR